MNKFKLPIIIFAVVFIISAAALIFFINKDTEKDTTERVEAPSWIHETGSSGRLPITSKVAKSPSATERNETANKTALDNIAGKTTQSGSKKSAETATSNIAETVNKFKNDIVTDVFLENLAGYVADNYQPAGSLPFKPKSGYSSASFKGINTYFGLNLMGLMPEAENIISARKSIWENLLYPGTLSKAYEKYYSSFLDLVEEKGITAEKKFAVKGDASEIRAFTAKERADMFKVSAAPLRHVAAVLTSIAENPDLVQAMDGYIKAEKRVERANAVFQKELTESNYSQSVIAKNKASHAGKILKDAIIVREKIKNGISDKIKTFCTGPCDTPNDAFYIAQWVFRRVKADHNRIESILSGSKLLSKLAKQMEDRAEAIKNNM
ncbi:hypothetical protein SAMN05660337_2101 [Maridesulfovibrio ferrireducens]|uniref:Uncharacterized protein n=1 Tax=Maridesulfovibrio ferrireducens TaxID=246191 RepID=A0A1G9HCP3_9BACT|nr:hypothetical protein [Maridesulfovibrio ferrireducens]SDL10615.1 hypothetical protein SAMN05660337_2101 [Maridesulfovibrio ferrireducens]